MLSNSWIDRSFERLGSFRIAWALISLCRTSKHFVRKRGRGRRRGRGRGRKRERKKWWHLKETPKWRLGGQRQPMAVVFRNGFFFFLSLPSLMHLLLPPFLSLSLPHPPAWNSVRAEAGCRIEGLSIFSGRIHSVCQFYPQEIRVFVPSSTPSFFPSPRPFFLFSLRFLCSP